MAYLSYFYSISATPCYSSKPTVKSSWLCTQFLCSCVLWIIRIFYINPTGFLPEFQCSCLCSGFVQSLFCWLCLKPPSPVPSCLLVFTQPAPGFCLCLALQDSAYGTFHGIFLQFCVFACWFSIYTRWCSVFTWVFDCCFSIHGCWSYANLLLALWPHSSFARCLFSKFSVQIWPFLELRPGDLLL